MLCKIPSAHDAYQIADKGDGLPAKLYFWHTVNTGVEGVMLRRTAATEEGIISHNIIMHMIIHDRSY